MRHNEELNPEQRRATLHAEGPLLIVAGAGAGKTKTIAHRILNLIERGIPPEQILAITFTNKAAREMEERVLSLLGERRGRDAGRPLVTTFHALGARMLRESGERIGVSRRFTILDRSDSLAVVRAALVEGGIDPKQFEPGRVLAAISRRKNTMSAAGEDARVRESGAFDQIILAAWRRYESLLSARKALDFDDLLIKPVTLLRDHADLRAQYQNRWTHLHIDEYQDTNGIQYELARLLAERHRNICVVGDADQTIYSWRGADIRNILEFENDYPGAEVVLLEENYRSTQTILSSANAVIRKNRLRKEKNLFTRNQSGEKISVFGAYDETDEARFIAERSAELIARGIPPEEIAVLYRANFQSRALEEAFLAGGVPYQVLGVRFFERKEVKDAVSYIRAALDPENTHDLARIINVPPRGIGKATVAKVLAGERDHLPAAAKARVASFFDLLVRIREAAQKEKPSSLLKFVLTETGMERLLRDSGEEGAERLENLRELVTLASRYDGMNTEDGLQQMLEDAALATDQDSLDEKRSAVKLMTVHAAKGLEFRIVFIAGLEEGLFPHRGMGRDSEEERGEEERRLFYVALTRAKEKVFLSHAAVRTIFGAKQVNIPSEFLSDIDSDFIEEEAGEGGRGEPLFTVRFD